MAEATREDIIRKAEEYVRVTRELADVKARADKLKAWFEALGVEDMQDSKIKEIDYWGDSGKVEVGRSETVTPVAAALLRQVFGAAYGELVQPKQTLELTANCKKLLAPIYLGNYIDRPIDDIIAAAVPSDPKRREALRKKLRGNYKTDRAALLAAGLSEKDAGDYAYLTAESVAYGKLTRLLDAAGWKGTVPEAVDVIRTAVVVTEGVKVTVDAPKPDEQ